MEGLVFDLQRYAIHDGPGIRTLVFLKGCPLKCKWCSNPESQMISNEIMLLERECIGVDKCGLCLDACNRDAIAELVNSVSINREKCNSCGECAFVCPGDTLRNTNRTMSVEEVVAYVERDTAFYSRSGGGVTLSGGEPLFQYDFCLELVKALKKKRLHIAMESTAFCSWEQMEELAAYVDLFLIDIKQMNNTVHRLYTGVDNTIILNNLVHLSNMGADIRIRIPLIPEINDELNDLEKTGQFVKKHLGLSKITLLPYHRLGQSKYEQLGKNYFLKELLPVNPQKNPQYYETRKKVFLNLGLEVSIGD